MDRHTNRFRSAVAVLTAGLVMTLAGACGDDGGSSEQASSGGSAAEAKATKEPIAIGSMCPKTGAIENVAVTLCPAIHDYVELVNSQGGISGHPVKVVEIDYAYEVPKGIAAYEQMKREGVVAIFCGGTGIALALNDRITADKIPCVTPGFGIAEASDGTKYPWQFPLAASYFSQAASVVDHIAKEANGKRVRLAFLYLDNPTGKEPLAAIERFAQKKGFELKTFSVPLPGLEMGAQITDIVSRFDADWVVTHLVGRAPSVAVKGLKQAGFPLDHVVAFVWGMAESDIEAAGGFSAVEGYRGLQFTGVGRDIQVIKDIEARYAARKQPLPNGLTRYTVYYDRGVFMAAVMLEGIRNAVEAGGAPVTGEKVKAGLESLRNFDLDGLAPPLSTSASDHEGGGFTQIVAVKDGKITPITDWINPDRDQVQALLAERNRG